MSQGKQVYSTAGDRHDPDLESHDTNIGCTALALPTTCSSFRGLACVDTLPYMPLPTVPVPSTACISLPPSLSVVLVGLGWVLVDMGAVKSERGDELFMYCAAGMRVPVEKIVADYEREFGVPVRVTYDGSNTLLSAITAHKKGDLYLAADDFYIARAKTGTGSGNVAVGDDATGHCRRQGKSQEHPRLWTICSATTSKPPWEIPNRPRSAK